MEPTIRPMFINDLESVNALSFQLGYELPLAETKAQMEKILSKEDHIAYVAAVQEKVIGWIHGFISLAIESKPFVEIGGLVVDEEFRGKGVGNRLVNKVKEWTIEKNIASLPTHDRQSISDGLVSQHAKFFVKIQSVIGSELRQDDANHLFLGVNPEGRRKKSAPGIFADRADFPRCPQIGFYRKSQPEPESIEGTVPHHRIADLIAGHKFYGLATEQAGAPKFAAVEQHL